jgi:hypothetical protein
MPVLTCNTPAAISSHATGCEADAQGCHRPRLATRRLTSSLEIDPEVTASAGAIGANASSTEVHGVSLTK